MNNSDPTFMYFGSQYVQQYACHSLNQRYCDLVRDHFNVFTKDLKKSGTKKLKEPGESSRFNSLELSPRKIE